MRILQILRLILVNSSFHCISVIFLNKFHLGIKSITNCFKLVDPFGICLESFCCRLSDMEFHFY